MSSFNKAIAYSFMGKYLGIVMQFGSMIILTRILSPEDYGIYTIAIIFVFIANILRNFGVNNYLIKEKTLTDEKLRSAFSLMIIISTLVGAALLFSAPFIADFYDEQKLVLMLQLLSFNIFISPFGSIITATLSRDLNFKPIVLVGMASQVASISTMIWFAYQGAQELTLVYGAITFSFFNFLFIQFYRPKNLPRLPGIGKIKEILNYTKYISAASIIGQLGSKSRDLVVGKHFDMESVGHLDRAENTAGLFDRLITEGLNPVLTPYISRITREKHDLAAKLKKLTNIQLSIAWTFYAMLAIIAEPAVVILYGEQWLIAATYLQIICIGSIIFSPFKSIDAIFLGKGFAKQVMKIQIVLNLLQILVVLFFVRYGIVSMMWALTLIIGMVRTVIYLYVIKKYLAISVTEYLSWMLKPVQTTLLVITPVLALLYAVNFNWRDSLALLMISLFMSLLIWLKSIWHQDLGILIKPVVISLYNKKFRRNH
jgi:O-antigen/teichoic acid export membrane protein